MPRFLDALWRDNFNRWIPFPWQITRKYMTVCCWINLKSWFCRTHIFPNLPIDTYAIFDLKRDFAFFRRILILLKILNNCTNDSELILRIPRSEVCVCRFKIGTFSLKNSIKTVVRKQFWSLKRFLTVCKKQNLKIVKTPIDPRSWFYPGNNN